jgi:hypothetical protein
MGGNYVTKTFITYIFKIIFYSYKMNYYETDEICTVSCRNEKYLQNFDPKI